MSTSNYAEDKIADHMTGRAAWTKPTNTYIKLHTGDPGEAGTSNAATEATRKVTSFAASSGGVIASNADLEWTSVAGTETYSHVSLWDAATSGNCIATGAMGASKAVTAGDTFTIPSGDLTLTVT